MIRLTIPGEPVAKGRPRVLKTGTTYTPKKTKNYETLVKEIYVLQHNEPPMEGELFLELKAYFSIPKSAPKKKQAAMIREEIRPTKKPDIDNLVKTVTDALNTLAYRDDSQIVEARVGKYYSEQPRVEIIIQSIEKGEAI
ncbi:RusA family crossover junction endodeoxyribonuclease [Thermotalea metallivorans]|uniref:Holliday junction resolvase n=1 Tax=Thermotalea metallivorans TaxID=520762 RepID=A0A140LCJ2_9FIRM|nr:RusA family crossover junction endodeoxyribonuclease [Thermotalea metallivorans]KXG78267.1 hypothetical protein AN619_02420 [Thermotalea metallivorans]